MIETRKPIEGGRSASPEETRERILTATREIIGRKGKRGATTREIADVAGVNEATLFRHFGTKEALLVACAQILGIRPHDSKPFPHHIHVAKGGVTCTQCHAP